jgi:DUF4097 and DUF4098 domain-containing protein YvlB
MSPEFEDVLEKRFRTSGRPVLRVENVAGETRVRGSAGDEVVVRATKRTHAESPERGKRVLENIDIEMEQEGDEIHVSQRAFLLERGWANLFRDRRAVVDYEIEVPTGAILSVRSASGEIEVAGIVGEVELQSVSGDVVGRDVRGPVRLRSVSGDCTLEQCAGPLEANAVSGDLTFHGCAWPSAHVRTISGDVDAEVRLEGRGPVIVNTVSGDFQLATPSAMEVAFDTTSGDLDAPGMVVAKVSRRSYVAKLGEGGADVRVHTVSGDVTLRQAEVNAPDVPAAAAAAPASGGRDRKAEALEVLRALEQGEIDADEAARRLDAVRS